MDIRISIMKLGWKYPPGRPILAGYLAAGENSLKVTASIKKIKEL
jgi:hypothetical protein